MWCIFISWNRHRFKLKPFTGDSVFVFNLGGIQIGFMKVDLEFYIGILTEALDAKILKVEKEEEKDVG